jgi:hypothetical protein
MSIPAGPLRYTSPRKPIALTEEEEAALAFAACGVTGYALADLSYGAGEGGSMLANRMGRTVASPDAVNTVAVVVTNDHATYLLRRPQDFLPSELPDLIRLAHEGALVELYRRSRIKLCDGRAKPGPFVADKYAHRLIEEFQEGVDRQRRRFDHREKVGGSRSVERPPIDRKIVFSIERRRRPAIA